MSGREPGDAVEELTERARAELLVYGLLGEPSSLDSAVRNFRAALQAAGAGGPARSVALANLAAALLTRFEVDGRPDDLSEAVDVGHAGVAGLVADHPARPGALTNLGAALLARYERGGSDADLDRAVTATESAAAGPSPDPGATASMLAMALLTRYQRDGRPEDLEAAHAAARVAVESTSDADPGRGARLSNLSITLRARYELTGGLADLDEAIRSGIAAVEVTAAARPERAMYRSNLAGALCTRFERTGSRRDLDAAITLARAAVDVTAGSSPHRAARLSILGLALRLAVEHSGDAGDLDDAVGTAREAVAAAGAHHPEHPDHLANLSVVLRLRAERGEGSAAARDRDVDESVACAREAVTTGSGRPATAVYLLDLGHALAVRHVRSGDRQDLWRALVAYRRAAAMSTASAVHRLAAAHRWGFVAREHGCVGVALAGYAAAVRLLPLAAWHGLDRRSRDAQLADHTALATAAAEAAVAAGRPDRAVELVEQGRTVAWTQQLRLRGDLGELARRRPDLAERLDRVRRLLDRPVEGAAGGPDQEARRILAAEWDAVLAQVRDLDGFAHFLEPRPVDELRAAAEAGPVLIVNVAARGCHALVLQPPDGRNGGPREPVRVLALPGLTRSEALARAHGLRRADRAELGFDQRQELIDDLLDWLWRVVAEPVLGALGPAIGAERLCWCLTGPLTLLPVHAARAPEPEHRTGGWGIPSYTVTVHALLRSRRRSVGRSVRQLVIGVPESGLAEGEITDATMTPLPATAREVARVTAHARPAGPVRELVGPAATRQRVREELSGSERVHLACHVRQNATDPSGTGLLLADGLLTVAQLAELDLHDAELAVLSACGTAVGSDRLPEEAMHVAAALQVIGYRHVVATLWSVPDAAGAHFADAFYDGLGAGRSELDAGGAMLHAVRALRERYADRPAWAPYVHFGP